MEWGGDTQSAKQIENNLMDEQRPTLPNQNLPSKEVKVRSGLK